MKFVIRIAKSTAITALCLSLIITLSSCEWAVDALSAGLVTTSAETVTGATTAELSLPSLSTTATLEPTTATTTTITPTTAVATTAAPTTTAKPTVKPTTPTTIATTTTFTEPDKIHLPGVPANVGFSGSQAMIDQFIGLVNQLRIDNNRLPLTVGSSSLQQVAAIRAAEASVLWSHTRPTDDKTCDQWSDLFDALGVRPSHTFGENLAYNNYSTGQAVQEAMEGLVASDGHLINMLNQDFTHIAISVYLRSDGRYFFSQEFAG